MVATALFTLFIAANPSRVAVIPIVGADENAMTRGMVRAVGDTVDERVGLSAITLDELFSSDGTALMTAVKRCGTDDNCVRRSIRDFGADFGVVVVMNRRVSPPVVQLALVPGVRSVPPTDPRVANVADATDEATTLRRLTDELLDAAGHVRYGHIEVVTEPPGASVVLDDVAQPLQVNNRFDVAPGPHRVKVLREGYLEVSETRDVAAGETWTWRPVLREAPSSGISPWVWVGVAAVVVAGGVVAGLALAPRDTTYCLHSPNIDGC